MEVTLLFIAVSILAGKRSLLLKATFSYEHYSNEILTKWRVVGAAYAYCFGKSIILKLYFLIFGES